MLVACPAPPIYRGCVGLRLSVSLQYIHREEHSLDCGGAPSTVEVLFSVPKRNHKRANRRNLLRRRTKEAYRLQKQLLWQSAEAQGVAVDMALVYSTKEVLSYKTIENAVRRILEEVAQRC